MASTSPHSPRLPRSRLGLAIGLALLSATGCADSPSQQAGTIELPDRKFAPPPDAKSFAKERGIPKGQNP